MILSFWLAVFSRFDTAFIQHESGAGLPATGTIKQSANRLPREVQYGQNHSTAMSLTELLLRNQASGLLLDWNTGRPLASIGEQRSSAPGSLLKPLLLAYALRQGIVDASTRVYCRRDLHVGGHLLACTHPASQPMLDAQGALAASCNTWFASLARRMGPQQVEAALRQAGVTFATADLNDSDVRVLTALGLENVTATPMQVATAYRALLLHASHTGAVWKGLQDSVAYGMAANARVAGTDVLGKTGTATNRGEWWSHGWFAGAVPGRFVVVIYVPRGDGGTAAKLAGEALRLLLHSERP